MFAKRIISVYNSEVIVNKIAESKMEASVKMNFHTQICANTNLQVAKGMETIMKKMKKVLSLVLAGVMA